VIPLFYSQLIPASANITVDWLSANAATPTHKHKMAMNGALMSSRDQSSARHRFQGLTHPDHPLTGRVIVNRIRHWRFGRGLSPTVDNFGLLGQPPTRQELLDWMTRRFLECGGSLKKLHRMMMLTGATAATIN